MVRFERRGPMGRKVDWVPGVTAIRLPDKLSSSGSRLAQTSLPLRSSRAAAAPIAQQSSAARSSRASAGLAAAGQSTAAPAAVTSAVVASSEKVAYSAPCSLQSREGWMAVERITHCHTLQRPPNASACTGHNCPKCTKPSTHRVSPLRASGR